MADTKPRFQVMFIVQRAGEVGPFPVTVEAARRAIESAASQPADDRPFPPSIIEAIEQEPRLLRWALQHLYAHLVKRGVGAFYMDDAVSTYWAVMARDVAAFSIEDLELRPVPGSPAPPTHIGFSWRPDFDPDSTEGS